MMLNILNPFIYSKDDIELLFHLYWLPHSNGTRAEALIKSFRELRDYAHIIQKLGLYKVCIFLIYITIRVYPRKNLKEYPILTRRCLTILVDIRR